MSEIKSRNPQQESRTQSISSDADEWGRLFVRILESEFAVIAAGLRSDAKSADFQQAMLRAVVNVLRDSGAELQSLADAFQTITGPYSGSTEEMAWSREENSRRLELIDKSIQREISPEEAVELAQLTARMRRFVDREDVLPFDGAILLHRQLLEKAAVQRPPQ